MIITLYITIRVSEMLDLITHWKQVKIHFHDIVKWNENTSQNKDETETYLLLF